MKASLRRRFEMGMSVYEFLRAHPPEGAAAVAMERLHQLLERAEGLGLQQRGGMAESRSSKTHRDRVRQALQSKLLLYLSVLAAGMEDEHTELRVALRLPRHRLPHRAFLTLARVMLEKATEHRALLMSHGMSETLLDDLAAAIAEFEHSLELTNAGQRRQLGATADLKAVASEISRQVRVLDGWVRYRYGENPELMAAWASAHNVIGPSRKSPPAGEGPKEGKAA